MPKVTTKETKEKKVAAAAPDKKKRKPKKEKDPGAPKRALSAYMFFVQDWRERIKSENSEASFGELGKLLGAKWKDMSDSEKKVCASVYKMLRSSADTLHAEQPYEDKAKADKERAATDKTAYEGAGAGGKKPAAKKSAAKVEEEDDEEDSDE
ncbi:hypothetical protein P7C73_g3814, partial [Tremellales sp. Uapishka_1]